MFENRISSYFSAPNVTVESAFVPCPAPLFATFTASHQAYVAEVYRRAQELTDSQFRKPARRPVPEFSLN